MVGNSLCKKFFRIKNRTWIVESSCIFFSMALLAQFFFSCFWFAGKFFLIVKLGCYEVLENSSKKICTLSG